MPGAILSGVQTGGLSVVSGHTTITFTIAGLLALVLPRRWGARVRAGGPERGHPGVPGAHNPLDVVGGAAVGLAIAALLDLVLDVARDRGGSQPGQAAATGEDRAA